MNENSSVRIESAWSKTSNNGPLRNRNAVSIARSYVDSKIVCFYESDHAFKTIWRRPCSCHLIKIKACFLKPDRPVFIIVINTSCSGLTALWHYLEFLSGVYPVTNALTLSIYYYISTWMGDHFSALLLSMMALRFALIDRLIDRNPFQPCSFEVLPL